MSMDCNIGQEHDSNGNFINPITMGSKLYIVHNRLYNPNDQFLLTAQLVKKTLRITNALRYSSDSLYYDYSKIFQLGHLVGGFNPFEKYARQIGSFPQVGGKIKNIWNHHPVMTLYICRHWMSWVFCAIHLWVKRWGLLQLTPKKTPGPRSSKKQKTKFGQSGVCHNHLKQPLKNWRTPASPRDKTCQFLGLTFLWWSLRQDNTLSSNQKVSRPSFNKNCPLSQTKEVAFTIVLGPGPPFPAKVANEGLV